MGSYTGRWGPTLCPRAWGRGGSGCQRDLLICRKSFGGSWPAEAWRGSRPWYCPWVGKSEAVPWGWAVLPAISASFPSPAVNLGPCATASLEPGSAAKESRMPLQGVGVLRCAFELPRFAGLGVRNRCEGGKIPQNVLDCSRRRRAILEDSPRLL